MRRIKINKKYVVWSIRQLGSIFFDLKNYHWVFTKSKYKLQLKIKTKLKNTQVPAYI